MKSLFYPQRLPLLFCGLFLTISFTVFGQVGIGTIDPKTSLDINGALALREGSELVLTNNNNINIDLGVNQYSHYRISGPTSDFNIQTFLTPNGESAPDGQLLILINTTPHKMTIKHDSGSGSNPQRRIFCPSGRDMILDGQNSTVSLQYNTTIQRWVVIGYAASRYGDNIQSAIGSSDISTDSSSFNQMADMSIVFTPVHSVVYITFSAAGSMDISSLPNAAYADFRLQKDGITQAGTTTLTTDFDSKGQNQTVAVSWNAQISMFPVNVTPGQATTITIQWRRGGIQPTDLLCNVNSQPDWSHRNLTILD